MQPGADMGPADVQREGAYRRGYHQCAAELMHAMQGPKQITAAMLEKWVVEAGMEWRKDKPLDRMILAPDFVGTGGMAARQFLLRNFAAPLARSMRAKLVWVIQKNMIVESAVVCVDTKYEMIEAQEKLDKIFMELKTMQRDLV